MKPEQIQAIKDNLYKKTSGWKRWTSQLRQLDTEVSCMEMMISFFAYHGIATIRNEESYFFQQYLQKYVDKLGRERFDEIREDMIKDFEKATVHKGVYEDHEGCTYNSIEWGD